MLIKGDVDAAPAGSRRRPRLDQAVSDPTRLFLKVGLLDLGRLG